MNPNQIVDRMKIKPNTAKLVQMDRRDPAFARREGQIGQRIDQHNEWPLCVKSGDRLTG